MSNSVRTEPEHVTSMGDMHINNYEEPVLVGCLQGFLFLLAVYSDTFYQVLSVYSFGLRLPSTSSFAQALINASETGPQLGQEAPAQYMGFYNGEMVLD